MNRAYWLYLVLLLFTMTVMSLVTHQLRMQERSEQLQSLTAENERLALWRIESKLLPLVIRESSRTYDDALFDATNPTDLPAELIGCFRLHSTTSSPKFDWRPTPFDAPENTLSEQHWDKQVQEDCKQSVLLAAIDTKFSAPLLSEQNVPQAESYLSNALQQSARSELEFRNRSSSQTLNVELLNQIQSQAFPIEAPNRIEPLAPVWVDTRLYLVRRNNELASESVEGCLVNWHWLKPQLLLAIRDLLPSADLRPQEMNSDMVHSLASLPVQLIPGEPDFASLPVSSALWPTLIIAWTCFLVSAIALGVLLIGVVRLSERRAAFVSAVTHELRTPLTTLRLYADLLTQTQTLPSDKYDRYVQTLRREANRLHYLIENVLGWSRLEQSAATHVVEPIQWQALLERLQPALEDRTAQAGCTLVYEPTEVDAAVTFRGNATAVERILFNLIDNACKYSKTGQSRYIHLDTSIASRCLHIAVRDHGSGIDETVKHRLFKPFSKSAEQAARSAPGIGLGLSLSRRLARDMCGDLRLVQSDDEGTTFELRLPLA